MHSQWRIDNKSLVSFGGGTKKSNDKVEIKVFLDKLYEMYQ